VERTPEPPGLRSPEVCAATGITYRQLDYWVRTGLVSPSITRSDGPGIYRLYSPDDLARLRAIKVLIDFGVSLQKVRQIVTNAGSDAEALAALQCVGDGLKAVL